MKPTGVIVAGIIILSFLSGFVNSDAKSYYEEIGFSLDHSSSDELVIRFKPIISGWNEIITEEGVITKLPDIKGASLRSGDHGSPSIVEISVLITVPDVNGFDLSDFSVNDISSFPSSIIAPIPTMTERNGFPVETYSIDYGEYKISTPQNSVSLSYAGIQRDRHIAKLTIPVAIYNSAKASIDISNEVRVVIRFSAKNYPDVRLDDDFGLITTINHRESNGWRIRNTAVSSEKAHEDKQLSLSSGNWLKITINKEGIYKIDASQITGLGFNIPKDLIGTIKIFGNGGTELSELPSDAPKNVMNEQPIIVKTNASGELESIVFYGASTNGFKYNKNDFYSWYNHYSDKNFYMLTWGGNAGLRAEPSVGTNDAPSVRPLSYTERIFLKEEVNCALIGGSGRIWFGGSIFPRSFSNSLNNLDRNGKIKYRLYFTHRADGTGTFTVAESGKNIATTNIAKTTDSQYLDAYGEIAEVEIPASEIPGDNRSLINVNYTNPKIAGSTPFFNWLEIHYPRSFVPVDGQLGFWSNQGDSGVAEYSINGFNGEILGFEVSNPGKPAAIINKSVTGGLFVFADSLRSANPKRYFVASNFQKPELAVAGISNLRMIEDESEVIIITHKNLLESAKKYQEYRKDRKSIIVTTEEIYNEFNAGLPDPTALRDYLAYRLQNSSVKPKYVVLWGDGHYDNKNIQTKAISFVPTYQSLEKYDQFKGTESYTSDDYFAWLSGNDRYNDIIIGRLPISSNEEGEWMVEKSSFYENNSSLDNWRTYLTLVADDSPTSGGNGDGVTHTRQSETLAREIIPGFMPLRKLYLPEYPSENIPNGRRKPKLNEDLLSYINNAGTLTLNWVGHGNPRVWAHEEIFDRDKTIAQFKNLNKMFLNTAATCDFARYDMTETRSGAELMLLSRNGGSIGEFSSTRVVYSYDNARINETFHTELFRRKSINGEYPDIGEVMYAVKQLRANSNDIKYNYLGDPLVKILIPYHIVRIDKINDTEIKSLSDTAKIKAMSKVTVDASIINPVDSTVVTEFNGLSNLTLNDADYSVNITDIDGTTHSMLKYGGALNRGTFSVVNGKIKAEFYIPEDISFSTEPGRLFIYAFTDSRMTAVGATRQFRFAGIDTITSVNVRPQINIYLDTISFVSGDIVSENPLLIVRVKDDFGVNTSGSGIGHRLEAWIDDDPQSIDLTYRTSIAPDDIKTVEAKQVLSGLAPGIHKIRVRAWNVFNNYSIEETQFRILSGDEGAMIWNATPYPNPFQNQVTMRFRHNLNQPFTANLAIYDMLGSKVREQQLTVTSVHSSEIKWDGTDEAGRECSQGQYILRLDIFTHIGNASITSGAVLIR